MRGWATVARKEFLHMLHDRTTLAVTLLMPIVQLLFYGFILDTHIHNVPSALVNLDTHSGGRLLAMRITRSPLFDMQPQYTSQSAMESALRAGNLRVGIVIPPDYSSALLYGRSAVLQVWIDGADVATSNYVLTALEAMGKEEARARVVAVGAHPEPLNGSPDTVSSVTVKATVLFNPSGRAAGFLLPGLIALLVQAITTLLLVFSFTTEREQGTLEQMRVSGMPRDAIIAGKSLAVASVGLLESAFLVWLMQSLFHIQVQGSFLLLLAVLPLLVLAPIGFGLLIAAVAPTQARALQIAPMLLFPSVMLSGFIFPREFLNFPLAWVGNLLPTTYLVALSRTVLLRGASAQEAAPGIAASLLFGLLVTAAGWWAARRSLR